MLRSGSAPLFLFSSTLPFQSRDLCHMVYHLTSHLTLFTKPIVCLNRGCLLFSSLLFSLPIVSTLLSCSSLFSKTHCLSLFGRLVR